ncbi:hypothetical protein ACLOJK_038033 [Asimina triloba]
MVCHWPLVGTIEGDGFFCRTSMRKTMSEEEAPTVAMLGDASDRRWSIAIDQCCEDVLPDEADPLSDDRRRWCTRQVAAPILPLVGIAWR